MEGNNDSMTSEIMTNLMILLVACENNEIETTYLMEVSKNFLRRRIMKCWESFETRSPKV